MHKMRIMSVGIWKGWLGDSTRAWLTRGVPSLLCVHKCWHSTNMEVKVQADSTDDPSQTNSTTLS